MALKIFNKRNFEFDKARPILKVHLDKKKAARKYFKIKYPICTYLYKNIGIIVAIISAILLLLVIEIVKDTPSSKFNGEVAFLFFYVLIELN